MVTPFYDGFCAAVHNDDNLDNTQRFQYLASTLSGEASRAIDRLPLTNANYDEALSVLKQRYGQPHKIIAGYMKALWELPKPTDSIACVKDFYDSLETYIRGLKSLGKTEESYGDLRIPIILEKLPGSLKTHISRTHGVWFMVYWGLTPQQQPGSYQGGEMMMMKSVFWWRKPEYLEETTNLRQVTDETLLAVGLMGQGLDTSRTEGSSLQGNTSFRSRKR